ncbi:hypothetical protein AB2M62_04410 [Sphingomonas sp. MMS12-HWE2-04]|uniref:hypothetical protein n=1 Tax=Sphingomonas sp. MMS12-HWE2-04 TaxID=3234199 RepID=UPI0038514A40
MPALAASADGAAPPATATACSSVNIGADVSTDMRFCCACATEAQDAAASIAASNFFMDIYS